jgi:hypothetical protein
MFRVPTRDCSTARWDGFPSHGRAAWIIDWRRWCLNEQTPQDTTCRRGLRVMPWHTKSSALRLGHHPRRSDRRIGYSCGSGTQISIRRCHRNSMRLSGSRSASTRPTLRSVSLVLHPHHPSGDQSGRHVSGRGSHGMVVPPRSPIWEAQSHLRYGSSSRLRCSSGW